MKKSLSLALIATLLLALVACGTPTAIPNPPLILGEKYLTDLDYEQALLQFDQAIIIEPKNPRGYLGKADALLHLDRQADAASALDTGAKQCRAQRAALNEAKGEIAKSLVEGYIALSSAYDTLGWREIALALLKRVCEELPEESRLREALERLISVSNNANQQDIDMVTTPVALPDSVFGMKDVLECGLIPGLDVYEIAQKLNIPRSRVFDVDWNRLRMEGNFDAPQRVAYVARDSSDRDWTIQWETDAPVAIIKKSDLWHETQTTGGSIGQIFFSGNGGYSAAYHDRQIYAHFVSDCFDGIEYQLIRGIGFGMSGEEVLRKFYYSEDLVIIENGAPMANPKTSLGNGYTLYAFPDQLDGRDYFGYFGKTDFGYVLEYHFIDQSTNADYTVKFEIIDNVVASIYWNCGVK